MKINKIILNKLRQAVLKQPEDLFVEGVEKIFHNKASIDINDYNSNNVVIEVYLNKECYKYWNDFVKNYLQIFSFDNIFNDSDDIFKYEEEGYEPRDGIESFDISIIFEELFDVVIKNSNTFKDIIESASGETIDDKVDFITNSYKSEISKAFGGIDDDNVKFLVYRLIEADIV